MLLSGLLLCSVSPAAASPRVVVSIAPVHSLVSALMEGVGEPQLLVPPGQSPHTHQLRPSELERLTRAELVIWIGPAFEISLRKPVSLLQATRQLVLMDAPGVQLLEARDAGVWAYGHEHAGETGAHLERIDPHLWLSTGNAEMIAAAVAQALIEIDPENETLYRNNLNALSDRIAGLRQSLKTSLGPLGGLPYLVFHDAYHYFEHEFGLNPLGAVTLSPERKPGARTLLEINRAVAGRGARCVFHEPQFEPRMVQRIAETTGLWVGELDPIGAALTPGPGLWFELMTGLRDSLQQCAEH